MKKSFTLFAISILLFGCTKNNTVVSEKPLSVISFASCCEAWGDKKIFDRIVQKDPQVYIAGGDNIYGDFFALAPGTAYFIQGQYDLLAGDKSWIKLRAKIPMLPMWDDHDTGDNDGTSSNPVIAVAKDLFFKFWNIPADAPRHNRPDGAIYDSYYYGDEAHKVQIILMDIRSNHTPYKETAHPVLSHDTLMSPDATMLGATQWAWLEGELMKPAKLRLILSTVQFNSLYNGGENWALLPLEKQKMYDLIKSTQANGVLFISGDVHYAELTKVQLPGMYPIYDFTSSGITHHEDHASAQNDPIRVGPAWAHVNFGLITIDWNASPVTIKMEIYGNTDPLDAKISHTVTLDELKF